MQGHLPVPVFRLQTHESKPFTHGAGANTPAPVPHEPPGSARKQQPQSGNRAVAKSLHRQQQILKLQRWLVFLRHCAKCQQEGTECQFSHKCRAGKQLWAHILQCNGSNCDHPQCSKCRALLKHHQQCQDVFCPLCVPVKVHLERTRRKCEVTHAEPVLVNKPTNKA